MTVRDILHIAVRRWYTTAIAIVLATILAVVLLQNSGVYSTRTTVEFRWPGAARIETDSGFTNDSVISFAEMVALTVNGGRAPLHYSQDAAPLYGVGRRDAEVVNVTFSGNQWITDHSVAEVAIQVVGTSEDRVVQRQAHLIDEVIRAANELQEQAGVPVVDYVVEEIDPLSRTIQHVVPSRISIIAAVVALVAAAAMTGIGMALLLDRSRVGRRRAAARGTWKGAIR